MKVIVLICHALVPLKLYSHQCQGVCILSPSYNYGIIDGCQRQICINPEWTEPAILQNVVAARIRKVSSYKEATTHSKSE